jgi:hypothetical protein
VALGGWTTGLLTTRRLEAPDPAGDHAVAVPARADHAPGARRDAGGAAHRLHQVRARARACTDRAVNFGHALKNTLVPVITITGLQLGSLIAFAIITETVFQWPGMGLLFIQAVQFADIPVMAAYLCLIALIFVLINLVVDLLYFAGRSAAAHRAQPRALRTLNPMSTDRHCPSPAPAPGPRRRRLAQLQATRRWPSWRRSIGADRGRRACSRPGSRRTTPSTWRRST